MGCDYYDLSREGQTANLRQNDKLINDSGCKRIAGAGALDYVACCKCGAMIWTGNLHQESDLPFVRAHHHWHKGRTA